MTEQLVLFRIILNTKYPDNELPIRLFQAMEDDVRRDHLIMDIDIAQDSVISNRRSTARFLVRFSLIF